MEFHEVADGARENAAEAVDRQRVHGFDASTVYRIGCREAGPGGERGEDEDTGALIGEQQGGVRQWLPRRSMPFRMRSSLLERLRSLLSTICQFRGFDPSVRSGAR